MCYSWNKVHRGLSLAWILWRYEELYTNWLRPSTPASEPRPLLQNFLTWTGAAIILGGQNNRLEGWVSGFAEVPEKLKPVLDALRAAAGPASAPAPASSGGSSQSKSSAGDDKIKRQLEEKTKQCENLQKKLKKAEDEVKRKADDDRKRSAGAGAGSAPPAAPPQRAPAGPAQQTTESSSLQSFQRCNLALGAVLTNDGKRYDKYLDLLNSPEQQPLGRGGDERTCRSWLCFKPCVLPLTGPRQCRFGRHYVTDGSKSACLALVNKLHELEGKGQLGLTDFDRADMGP